MKLTTLLQKNQFSISFEVFPPKTDAAFESVRSATEKIAALHPSFMSVTYGAGGGSSTYTLDIARNIQQQYGVPTIAHLTCVCAGTFRRTSWERSGVCGSINTPRISSGN